jgi:hypothetical protein
VSADEESLRCARVIWDYLHVGHQPVPGDVILAFGTNDLRVAEFAADLYHRGFGGMLVCSGGVAHAGDLLATGWERPEAEMFAEVAVASGVPGDRILLEDRSINTAQNVRFTRALLSERGVDPARMVLACKPFMQRRVWATMAVEWPEMPATVASPAMTLDEYFTADLTPERILNIMMGDLQRVWVYGRKGWSAPQPLPREVEDAYRELKARGFTRHLLAED